MTFTYILAEFVQVALSVCLFKVSEGLSHNLLFRLFLSNAILDFIKGRMVRIRRIGIQHLLETVHSIECNEVINKSGWNKRLLVLLQHLRHQFPILVSQSI